MEYTRGIPEIAGIAALIGDPAREEVLTALLADRALSATELAAVAGVGKSTISSHLEKLVRAGLVAVERRGRYKQFRLSGRDVARLLEALMGVAVRTGALRLRAAPADPALRKARVCYDHLAGELGVLVHESLVGSGALRAGRPRSQRGAEWELTAAGVRRFRDLGIDPEALRSRRRSFCRSCLDWSERRHHLAGAVGAALLQRILELRWARQSRSSRTLVFSASGEASLRRAFSSRQAARSGGES